MQKNNVSADSTESENTQVIDLSKYDMKGLGSGYEGLSEKSLKANYLILLQDQSKTLKANRNTMSAGEFYASRSGKSLGPSFEFIPIAYVFTFSHWSGESDDPEAEFIGNYSQEIIDSKLALGEIMEVAYGQYATPEGQPIRENHIIVMYLPADDSLAYFSCTKTKVGPLKDLLGKMVAIRHNEKPVPMYLQRWKLSSILDENKRKQEYWNIGAQGVSTGEFIGLIDSDLFNEKIKPARQQFAEGKGIFKSFAENAADFDDSGASESVAQF